MIDAEALFDRVASERWADALDLVWGDGASTADDPVIGRALELLATALESRLADVGLPDEVVERYLLLGRSGRIPMGRDREGRVIDALLHRYRGTPERALSIARFRPDLPGSISVIGQYGSPASRTREGGGHRITSVEPGPDLPGAGRPIFRSALERTFHAAACRVFPSSVVQSNVALHAALDFDRVKGRLTGAERTFFFHGLVDCVVFDPEHDHLPVRFYELDSPVHDDAVRKDRDVLKNRILTVAGYRLVRIRPVGGGPVTEDALVTLLAGLESGRAAYIADGESPGGP